MASRAHEGSRRRADWKVIRLAISIIPNLRSMMNSLAEWEYEKSPYAMPVISGTVRNQASASLTGRVKINTRTFTAWIATSANMIQLGFMGPNRICQTLAVLNTCDSCTSPGTTMSLPTMASTSRTGRAFLTGKNTLASSASPTMVRAIRYSDPR